MAPAPPTPAAEREVHLLRMTHADYEVFARRGVQSYCARIQKSTGLPEADAAKLAQQAFDEALPRGLDTEGALLLKIVRRGTTIGHMRFQIHGGPRRKHAFAYEFEVYPPHRGYGAWALGQAVRILRDEGCARVSLQVFTDDERAYLLYQKIGFRVDSYNMSRDLAPIF